MALLALSALSRKKEEICIQKMTKDKSVIIDSDMNFNSDIKSLIKSAYCHLKSIPRSKGLISWRDLEKLAHPFIFSGPYYSNNVITGLPKGSIRQLQLLWN